MNDLSLHQKKQVEVINQIERQISNNNLSFSTVAPVEDFENDTRICLTSVHIPDQDLVSKVQGQIIAPLRTISPEHFYYPFDSLHMTVKNIRVINDPPHYNEADIEKAKKVFSLIIPNHNSFNVYFYRLLLFPMNLALVGTTDPELDAIFTNLDKALNDAGVPDDKKYNNSQYYFSNMTLARFKEPISEEFKRKVEELFNSISFEPYVVGSVTLLTCNAVFKKRQIIGTWNLK